MPEEKTARPESMSALRELEFFTRNEVERLDIKGEALRGMVSEQKKSQGRTQLVLIIVFMWLMVLTFAVIFHMVKVW